MPASSPSASCRATALRSSRTLPGHGSSSQRESTSRGSASGVAAELEPRTAREERDVAAASPQRRQLDARDGEAVEEVVAEAPGCDLAVEIAPRRGEDAHVDLDPLVAADAPDLAALDRAEELRLEREVEIADLVDEERAAVRLLEDAVPRRRRRR